MWAPVAALPALPPEPAAAEAPPNEIVEGMAARIVGLEKRVTGLEATIVGRATAQTPLTKFQFFKYFQEHEGKTPTECETKWNEMMAFALPEDMKDG